MRRLLFASAITVVLGAFAVALVLARHRDPLLLAGAGAVNAPEPTDLPASPALLGPYEDALQLLRDGRHAAALVLLDDVLASDPRFVPALLARAGAHLGQRQYRLARADYAKAAELDPTRATPVYGLARTAEKLGDEPAALALYRRYVEVAARDSVPALRREASEKVFGPSVK